MPDLSKVDKLPDWKDRLHYRVAERARAYLDVNCAHCHTKGGDAYNTGLFLEYQQTDLAHIGRMNATEAGTAMTELARTVIHKDGVRLIQQWIKAMKK